MVHPYIIVHSVEWFLYLFHIFLHQQLYVHVHESYVLGLEEVKWH